MKRDYYNRTGFLFRKHDFKAKEDFHFGNKIIKIKTDFYLETRFLNLKLRFLNYSSWHSWATVVKQCGPSLNIMPRENKKYLSDLVPDGADPETMVDSIKHLCF